MKTLLVDSSTPYLVVAIVEDEQIKYLYNNKIDSDLSAKFMVIIDEAFKQANIRPIDIDKIFISNGPGSFTGIRIGMTFAKVFAWSLKKDLISFTTLELLASTCDSGYVAALIDARRECAYCSVYNSNLDVIMREQYISINELNSRKKFVNSDNFVSYDSFDNMHTIFPKINVLKVIKKHINDTPINPNDMKPSYLKKTEAEEKIAND